MFCGKCGSNIPAGVNVCPRCGFVLRNNQGYPEQQGMGVQNSMPVQMQQKKRSNLPIIIGIIAGVSVLIIMFVLVLCFFLTRKTTIDLNKYVIAEYSGYDTVGNAMIRLDTKQLEADYAKKVKLTSKAKQRYQFDLMFYDTDEFDEVAIDLLLDNCISYKTENSSELSNGDTVSLHWKCNEKEASELFKVKLKYSDMSFVVEGLEIPEQYDPFSSYSVTFEGISPLGTATLEDENNQNFDYGIYLDLDKRRELKNGDVVTVRVPDGYEKNSIARYGITLTQTEQQVVVEGLDEYVTSASSIPDSLMQEIISDAERVFRDDSKDTYSFFHIDIEELTYAGNYFLNIKDYSTVGPFNSSNYLCVLLKLTAVINGEEKTETVEYYYMVAYSDLIKKADGSIEVDLNDSNHWVNEGIRIDDSELAMFTIGLQGYRSLDEVYDLFITENINEYDVEYNLIQ